MSTNLSLLVVVGIMAACGVYLLMERSLVRMLFGLLLVGNALNLLIVVTSGGMGNPPIMGRSSENRAADADPLAQGMVLTAIVIMMGVAAFVLALVYRLFVINRNDDDVEDDVEDVKILTGSLGTAPDRDRSDDPDTLSDTPTGDYFDDEGNPLTPEEVAARATAVHETDLMPTDDNDVVDELGGDDTDGDGTGGTETGHHHDPAAEHGGHFEELDSDKSEPSEPTGPPPAGPHEHGSRAHGAEEHGPGELGPDEVGPKGSEARAEDEKPEDIPAEQAEDEERADDEQAPPTTEGDNR